MPKGEQAADSTMPSVSRERFVEHFHIVLQVQVLKLWPRRPPRRREAEAPELATDVVRWLRIANGRLGPEDGPYLEPIRHAINALYERTPRGERPTGPEFAGVIYDALAAAGMPVGIGEPPEGPRALTRSAVVNVPDYPSSHGFRSSTSGNSSK